MSEATNSTTPGAIFELRQAKTLLEEILASLESQKALLKQRGMSLPPTVITTLAAVQTELRKLEDQLVDEQTELSQLRALAQMASQITTTLEVNKVLDEAMDIVIALTRAERGYIVLVNKETKELDFRVVRDDTVTLRGYTEGTRPQISNTILQHVLTTRQPLLADNAFQDERLQGNVSIANFALRSVLCVPLLYRDDVVGVVYVDNRLQAGIFTDREKNTLMAFANIAAVAIANAFLYAELQQIIDEITRVKVLMDNVFASIGSGVIAGDAENIVQTFNRAAEKILARPAAATVGKELGEVLPRIAADLAMYLADVRKTGTPHTIEGEFNSLERRVAVSLKLTPLKDTDNNLRGVAVVVDDVTEQVEHHQQLRTLENYLPKGLAERALELSNIDLGGERREVTCLFVEVRPMSTLKDVPPREVMEILNEYLSVATRCIHETSGVIDKYMGNEVMALYNTQLNPQDNHAWLAVECALLMRDGFLELYQQQGIAPNPHYYRVGIHTGIATMGNVGSLNRRDFTAIGDTINLSKRLEENAEGAQIIISQATRDHLEATANGAAIPYRFAHLESITPKGKTQPVQIYEVFRL